MTRSPAPGHRKGNRGTEVSRDRRFWYGYFTIAYGLRDRELDRDVLSTSFEVDDEAAHEWWCEFTGWYDGVLDKSDGQVAEPGLLELNLEQHGGTLVVEAHPGDVYVRRALPGAAEPDLIANFGPHFWIPEWSLDAVVRQAGADPVAFLVLTPLVRLKAGDDRAAAEARFADACVRAGILTPSVASTLAREWVRRAAAEG